MPFRLLLLLLAAALLLLGTTAQKFPKRLKLPKEGKSERQKSSERAELLKALSSLISEAKEERGGKSDATFSSTDDYDVFRRSRFNNDERGGRQDEDFDLEYDAYDDYSEGAEAVRQGVGGGPEAPGGSSFSPLEECETTGFETRLREECEEVTEEECNPVTITEYKTEIVNRCKTLVDKTCNVTHVDVPKEVCTPTSEQKCKTEYKLVEEKLYKEECNTKVQNICEEHIKVPVEVPYPVPVPYHAPTPKYHKPPLSPYPPTLPPHHHPTQTPYGKPPTPPPHHHPTPTLYGHPPTPPPHHRPTPTPYGHQPTQSLLHHPTPTPYGYPGSPYPKPHPPTSYPVGLPRHPRAYQTTFSPSRTSTSKPQRPSPTPKIKRKHHRVEKTYSYDPTPTPKMSKNPLSDFIRRLGRQKREALGEPKGPPGFPIEMHPADQNSELQAAIMQLLRAQNGTSSRDKKAIGKPPEIIHFQDAFGHHGTLTKHHEFHHIPHPAVPSLGGHTLGHDHRHIHGHGPGHGHGDEHSHGHQISHPHTHSLSHSHPQPQPHPHIESLQQPLTATQLEDALTEILLELNHGGSFHNSAAPHPVPAHHQTPLIQTELIHQLGGLLQTSPLPIQPHHDPNLIETELMRQLESLLHTGPLPHPPEPINGHLDPLHSTPEDPNNSHDPFNPIEDPLHHHPDPLHPHADPLHPHVEPHLEGPPLPYDGVHPPIITTEELPAPYGCRAIATKTCNKVPYVVADKVPYETCELVPSVKCHLELKKVAELVCTPVIDEECNDFAKEVPYLIEEEQCEEVTFDDCVEIEEQVPVLLCQRTRLDDKSIFLQRGQVFRKEGEKRRRKTGRRGSQKDRDRDRERDDDDDDDEDNRRKR